MKSPFIAGSWVRGEHFYGRHKLIAEILGGQNRYLWIAGTRRFGKTSVLKQLEYLTTQPTNQAEYLALFWDMQGAFDIDGLSESLLESVEDVEEAFEAVGIQVEQLESGNVFDNLRVLKRAAKQHQRTLMLLCDECEELINVERNSPGSLARLRRSLQQGEHHITVLAATKRLMNLMEFDSGDTSPFLHGFIPPMYMHVMEEDAARNLIKQGGFSDKETAIILESTNRHPYLMQMLCKRLADAGDVEIAIESMCNDDMIAHFFAVDFDYLEVVEKRILWYVLVEPGINDNSLMEKTAVTSDNLALIINNLVQLGYLKQRENQLNISNYFFERWLKREKDRIFQKSDLIVTATPASQHGEMQSKSSSNWQAGMQIQHYTIREQIGHGNMGVIYKALDNRLQRTVALKLLADHLSELPEFRSRFLVEARAASVLNHPNIATIYEINEEISTPVISMEFINGVTLKQWIQSEHSLETKLDIISQVARGLQCAHENGVIHRDIKPDNIMITEDGFAKITDFGLAKIASQESVKLTRTGTTLGTLAYMSPEQAAGQEVDHRSDIYSLGVVSYEVLCSKLPFTSANEAAYLYALLNEDPQPLELDNADLLSGLQAVFNRVLQKNPENRYGSMSALLADFESVRS